MTITLLCAYEGTPHLSHREYSDSLNPAERDVDPVHCALSEVTAVDKH